jgi:hydrogenase maturation protease
MNGILVIGYGNTLRGDDGAGVRAAELIAMHYPNVHCLTVHQLTLDLAETLSQHATVVFLDASVGVNRVTASTLPIGTRPEQYDSHILTPLVLLNASHALYGRCPDRAIQIEIPASDFAFGETLSPQTLSYIEEVVQDFPSAADSPLSRWFSSVPS